MLDWISSKIGMIFTAVVIAGSIMGFFAWQRENFEDIQRQQTVDFIADQIDHISSLSGDGKDLFTFDFNKELEGIYLEPEIGGNPYEIMITPNHVVMDQKGEGPFISSLMRKVHLWNPSTAISMDILNDTILDRLDENNRSLTFGPGQDFYVESRSLNITTASSPMERIYLTFVYPA